MMILLSKAEYNELLKKAGNADVLAEEKLEVLKKDLREKILKLADPLQNRFSTPEEIARRLADLLQ